MNNVAMKKSIFSMFSNYDRDLVLYAFFYVGSIGRESLRKVYVLNNEDEVFISLTRNEMKSFNNAIFRMKKYLSEANFKVDAFYSLFTSKGYSKEEVDFVCNKINEYKEILFKKWGKDLNNNFNVDLSYEDMEIIYGIVPNIMVRELKTLRQKHKFYGVEDLFDSLTFSEICNKVMSFDESKKSLYYSIFGDDLSRRYVYKDFKVIVDKYKADLFENVDKGDNIDLKEFYETFRVYKKINERNSSFVSRIDKAMLEELNDDERKIIYKAFGDCSSCNKYRTSLEESKILKYVIIPKITLYLSPLNVDDVYEKIKRYSSVLFTKNEIICEINELDSYQKITLYSIDKLDEIIDSYDYYEKIRQKENKALIDVISAINIGLLKRKSKYLGIGIKTLRNIINLTKEYEFSYLEKLYGKDLSLAIMVCIYMKSVNYGVIYKLTNIREDICVIKVYEYLLVKIESLSMNCNVSLDDLKKINLLLETDEFIKFENQYGYYVALAIMIKIKIKNIENEQIKLITGVETEEYLNKLQVLSKKI